MSQAQECGMTFVKEYYNHLATSPDAPALTNMYTKFSQMVTEDGELVTGVEKIADVLSKKALEQRKFRLHGVGCYPSAYESILVLVRGVILTREASKNFNQTFLLVPVKDSTFYIYNDVLELTEDVDLTPAAAAPQEPAVPEYVEPEPAYEEPVPEPVEEPVQEPEPEPTPEPEPVVEEKPAPAPKAAPVKEEAPKPAAPAVARAGWAGILGRHNKEAAEGPAKPQVVSGGAIPGRVGATVKPKEPEARARGTSPVRRGTRGSSPQKFQKANYSIHVRLSGLRKEDISESDIEKLFSKFGKIGSKTLNVERGYCFVDFVEKKAMEDALAAAQNGELLHGGKALECGEKKPASKPGVKKVDEKPRGLTNGAAARRK